MERHNITVFIRLNDGEAKKTYRKACTIDEAMDILENEGFKVAVWETIQYYEGLRGLKRRFTEKMED